MLNTEGKGKIKFLHVWISKIFSLGNKVVIMLSFLSTISPQG